MAINVQKGTGLRLVLGFLAMAGTARAQGVPVIDGSNLAQNIQQLQQQIQSVDNQVQQIAELKQQVQTQISQLTNLQGMLKSITGINQIASLYNSIQDVASRAAKITNLSGFMTTISTGNFSSLSAMLASSGVTIAGKPAATYVQTTLSSAGFTPTAMASLNASNNPSGAVIANQAAASVTTMAASQIASEEAAQSLTRIDGLVQQIGQQQTLKDSVDLNTRMAAETNYMLGEMWRLNAAQGLSSGQQGINEAAQEAKTQAFFNYSGGN